MDTELMMLSQGLLDDEDRKKILGEDFEISTIQNLSIKTAQLFQSQIITYREADYIMQNIWDYWITDDVFSKKFVFPTVSRLIYDSFDEGEFYHFDKNGTVESVDPVEKYTIPKINNILSSL